MSHAVVVGVSAVAALALVPSVLAMRCNLRRFQEARTTAPLDGIDLSETTVQPFPAPKSWPVVEEVAEPSVAAAYAAFAGDLALMLTLLGDLLAVVGGAALGATIPGATSSPWANWTGPLALLVAGWGIVLRMAAERKWAVVEARYLERYEVLTAEPSSPPPPPAPPRRRGLFGWRRR